MREVSAAFGALEDASCPSWRGGESREGIRGLEGSVVWAGEGGVYYFGCALRHMLSLAAMNQREEEYRSDYLRRHAELIRCLGFGRDDALTYDLRFVAEPEGSSPSGGTVRIALLCRMQGGGPAEAGRHALQILSLLRAMLPEGAFDLMPRQEGQRLLRPFPLRHGADLRRRVELVRLDTVHNGQRRPPVGFTSSAPATPPLDTCPDLLLHVVPFLPSCASLATFFGLLLLQPHPILVSIRMRPTRLLPAEARFLEEQIGRCERYAQAGLDRTPDDLSCLRPTLRERAKLHLRHQGRLLAGLRDYAVLMSITAASPEPIPLPVMDALGAAVTEPAADRRARSEEDPALPLGGGWEVIGHEGHAALAGLPTLELPVPADGATAGCGRLPHLFHAAEAAAAFRLPPATPEPLPGVCCRSWRTEPAPRGLPADGYLIGMNLHAGAARPVRVGPGDLRRHMYVMGKTGSGKTTLLKNLALAFMDAGKGVCVIDPHGDLFAELLAKVPEHRAGDVILLDPTARRPAVLNPLEYEAEAQRHFLVQEMVGILARLLEDEYGTAAATQYAGPVFFEHVRMNLLLVMSDPADPGTLVEFYNVFQEPNYWKRWLPLKARDPFLERWVQNVLPKMDYIKPGSEGLSMGSYVASKFQSFIFDPAMRRLFGAKRSTIDLRAIMDQQKILLVNLAKGRLSEPTSKFLGRVLMAKLMAAALRRIEVPEGDRPEFLVVADEFQALATQGFASLLSESRKFGVSLVLANQFLAQVKESRIADAIFGNVGTFIAFRLGQADAELMEREFHPVFSRSHFTSLPVGQAYVRMVANGEALRPFSMVTLLDGRAPDGARAREVRRRSEERYGRPRHLLEEEIARSLAARPAGDEDE